MTAFYNVSRFVPFKCFKRKQNDFLSTLTFVQTSFICLNYHEEAMISKKKDTQEAGNGENHVSFLFPCRKAF